MTTIEKLEAGTVVSLSDTDTSAINKALLELPGARGAAGLVFTMVVVCSSRTYARGLEAAIEAGREHPARILVAVRTEAAQTKLDAEVRTSEEVPGDIVTLRMSGELNDHPESVIVPLLIPDLPAVVWWPRSSPIAPADDQIGSLVNRRITDIAEGDDPIDRLIERASTHQSGDTDLSWARLTRWRGILANALDQVSGPVDEASVEASANSVPAELMAAWLEARLGCPVERIVSRRRHDIEIKLLTVKGPIVLLHHGNEHAIITVPGQPDRPVVLPLRTPNQLLTEELRSLDSDPIFDETMECLKRRAKRGDIG